MIKGLNIRDIVKELTTKGMGALSNAEFSKFDKYFIACCFAAKVDASRRQASKFRMKRGVAYSINLKTSPIKI